MYLVCLISNTKQLMHEKVDHLHIQNPKYKKTSGTCNHHLYKNNEIKYLFHCQYFSFVNVLHILTVYIFKYLVLYRLYILQYISWSPDILPILCLVFKVWLLTFYSFFFFFFLFLMSFARKITTRNIWTFYLF